LPAAVSASPALPLSLAAPALAYCETDLLTGIRLDVEKDYPRPDAYEKQPTFPLK